MIKICKADDRGYFDHGWLKTYHTFSFGDYHDPQQMGFRALRVINEDRVAPGQGFGTHGHRDMEIVTYVLEGALEHRDSMGNGEVLRPGEFQRMTAGTGIQHSEFNPSDSEWVHLYQIWLLPEAKGLEPTYEQREFPPAERQGSFRLVADPAGKDGSLNIRQDARIYLSTLESGQSLAHELAPGRHAWLQVLRGSIETEGHALVAGDGVALSEHPAVTVEALSGAEIMLFDLA